jgi:hypothetical protein
MEALGYAVPLVVGACFLFMGFVYFQKARFKVGVILGVLGALFVLAPFPWWLFFAFWAVVALWLFWVMQRFARNRKAVMQQTGEKWYRYACEEIFAERGRQFLKEHFAETLVPERARTNGERILIQTAALGAYLRLLEEKGNDAVAYYSLPVDQAAVSQARVMSRVAIRSHLYKDHL